MRLVLLLLGLLAGLTGVGSGPAEAARPRMVALAIENVTTIDPPSGRVEPHRSVFVEQGRIVAIRPSGSPPAFRPARVIDGSGRYLIPGLADMHFHLFLPEPASPNLALLLANGVTAIREMSSDCWALAGASAGCVDAYKALQAELKSGAIPGPEIVSLTSAMVMGPSRRRLPQGAPAFVTPTTADQGRQLARYLATRGVDRIKTHDSIPRDAFYALMAEARRLGLEVSGHVPFGAGSLGAAERGYGSIEHARDLLYDCSRYGPELRRVMEDVAQQRPGAERPSDLVRLKRSVDEYDPPLCDAMLRRLARTGVYYVPTHVTREMEARAGEPGYRNDPRRKYIMAERDAAWEKDLVETAAVPAEQVEALRRFFLHGLEITRRAHEAGVKIMAGTDASDTMIVPGFSLHRELALLADAGLSPMEVLRSATSVPAAYLGRSRTLGGLSPGQEADLVLLRANPLDDIANTSSIEAVVSNGRLFDRAALDALLADAERAAARSRG